MAQMAKNRNWPKLPERPEKVKGLDWQKQPEGVKRPELPKIHNGLIIENRQKDQNNQNGQSIPNG